MMSEEKLLDNVLTYEAQTEGFQVRVQSYFMAHQSDPDQGKYFWAYRIEITNLGDDTAQLLNRQWTITDGRGRNEIVKGAGVIGEQPVFSPDEQFIYTSGCPLSTSSGFMVGHYEMIWLSGDLAGKGFMIEVPAFSLDSPDINLAVN